MILFLDIFMNIILHKGPMNEESCILQYKGENALCIIVSWHDIMQSNVTNTIQQISVNMKFHWKTAKATIFIQIEVTNVYIDLSRSDFGKQASNCTFREFV